MKQEKVKDYFQTPFRTVCGSVSNGPGYWDSTKVSIYRNFSLIGEYLRNYSSFGNETFYPFKRGDQWYALYSTEYTATRVMKLHDDRIEDWCGETGSSYGFCPVEFYVPLFVQTHESYEIKEEKHEYVSYSCFSSFIS